MPASEPAGYSGTPLPRKLGVRRGETLGIVNAPEGFDPGCPTAPTPQRVTLLFCLDVAALRDGLGPAARQLSPDGALWLCWPKQASKVVTDLTEAQVRADGLATGLVDVKVAAIDATWSGLKFVVRLADRPGRAR